MTEGTVRSTRDHAASTKLAWAERLSDRANPILVREILQAMSGRVFMVTLAIAALTVVSIGFFVAAIPELDGRTTLSAALSCLAPIVIFILPLQAFGSMWREVAGSTADQLFLTRLSPVRIVAGKLFASMAMFVLFLGMFSPLIALTYLLRGIDVLTIAIMLAFSTLASLVANSFAIAMAALSRVRWLAPIALIATIAGLGAGTVAAIAGAIEGVDEVQRGLSDSGFVGFCAAISIVGLYATTLFGAIAQALLAHEYENRSTSFRVIAIGLVLLAMGWCASFVDVSRWGARLSPLVGSVVVLLSPILIGLAAERDALSPRVARYVPGCRRRAWLLTPLLPGGGRGVMFGAGLMICLAALALAPQVLGWASSFGARDSLQAAVTIMAYTAILMVIARLARRSRVGSRFGFWGAFVLAYLVILGGLLLSLAMLAASHGGQWSVLQIVNIPWTVVESAKTEWVAGLMAVLAFACLLLVISDVFRGGNEVALASARRRELDAS